VETGVKQGFIFRCGQRERKRELKRDRTMDLLIQKVLNAINALNKLNIELRL